MLIYGLPLPEIVLPGTNTGTTAGSGVNKINSGQKILVIRTPKGVYIRTNDGKMFAVRSKTGIGLPGETASMSSASAATSTTSTVSLSTSSSNNQGMELIDIVQSLNIAYIFFPILKLEFETGYQLFSGSYVGAYPGLQFN